MKTNTRFFRKKGTALVEYGLLIAFVTAAFFGMQFYLKRSVCSRIKKAGDVFGFGRQYEPRETTITITGAGG